MGFGASYLIGLLSPGTQPCVGDACAHKRHHRQDYRRGHRQTGQHDVQEPVFQTSSALGFRLHINTPRHLDPRRAIFSRPFGAHPGLARLAERPGYRKAE